MRGTKTKTKTALKPKRGELPAEFQARQVMARCQLAAARAYEKQQKQSLKEIAQLSVYKGASMDRRNRDWMIQNASADLAYIPDALTLIARERQLARDFPLAQSAIKAFKRNVVGNGIQTIPHAKKPDGTPNDAFNRTAEKEFRLWAESKLCHVEGKQTWRQIQRLAASEFFTVGEHLLMWSYTPHLRPDGSVDYSKPCGLQVQGFEPEQFDLRKLSEPETGFEIRGGIELDENFKTVAFHLYTRNPYDYLYRHAFVSTRYPAHRFCHYMEHDRVLQSRGVSQLTAVMGIFKDLERYNSATLTRALMEACIGLIIKSTLPVPFGSNQSPTLIPQPGIQAATSGGLNTADVAPGMVGKLLPGEDVETLVPTAAGNTYSPFIETNTRIAGAGLGMSYGQLMRLSTGNYSAARQDMLTDRQEIEPHQTLIIDDIIRPIYHRFIKLAVAEGRFDDVEGFDVNDFYENTHRYLEADYVPPAQTWIDPANEAQAAEVLLKLNLITREQLAASRGQKFEQIVNKKEIERKQMLAAGLQVTEDDNANERKANIIRAIFAAKEMDPKLVADIDMEKLAQDVGISPDALRPPTPASNNGNHKNNGKHIPRLPIVPTLTDGADGGDNSKVLPPYKRDGMPEIEDAFYPQADKSKPYPGFSE